MKLKTNIIVCWSLGVLATASLVVAFLALTDIAKGEVDLGAEWLALQISFVVIGAFVVATIMLLTRVWALAVSGPGEVRPHAAAGDFSGHR